MCDFCSKKSLVYECSKFGDTNIKEVLQSIDDIYYTIPGRYSASEQIAELILYDKFKDNLICRYCITSVVKIVESIINKFCNKYRVALSDVNVCYVPMYYSKFFDVYTSVQEEERCFQLFMDILNAKENPFSKAILEFIKDKDMNDINFEEFGVNPLNMRGFLYSGYMSVTVKIFPQQLEETLSKQKSISLYINEKNKQSTIKIKRYLMKSYKLISSMVSADFISKSNSKRKGKETIK